MLKEMKPAYAFNPDFTETEFKEWQAGLRSAMQELMHFPEIADSPAPRLCQDSKAGWLPNREMGVLSVAR